MGKEAGNDVEGEVNGREEISSQSKTLGTSIYSGSRGANTPTRDHEDDTHDFVISFSSTGILHRIIHRHRSARLHIPHSI